MPSNDFEKDRTGPIKSSYVPPFGLQGQEFSCHVTWDHDYSLSSMNIKLEDGVSFKHIYNVGLDSINSTEEKEVEITNVIENGYVGYVIKSEALPENSRTVVILVSSHFVKESKNIPVVQKFELNLFRPELALASIPSEIDIRLSSDSLTAVVAERSKIRIVNSGPGLALTIVYPEINDKANFSSFFGSDESQLVDGLSKRFDELSQEYPEERDFLNLMLEWLSTWSRIDDVTSVDFDKFTEQSKVLQRELALKEKTAHDFLQDLNEEIADTFRSVITYDRVFQELLRSIENLKNGRILLLNTMTAIEVEEIETTINFIIEYTDAISNKYPALETGEIKIINKSGRKFKIPLYQLIDNGGMEFES